MKRSSVGLIACFLFHEIPFAFAILGQNECANIEIGDGQFVFSFNENKLIFLKIMPQELFKGSGALSPFTNNNTILIDDSQRRVFVMRVETPYFWSRGLGMSQRAIIFWILLRLGSLA